MDRHVAVAKKRQHCVARVKSKIVDGKYWKISNNCTRFESNNDVTIQFDSKFRIFAQHYPLVLDPKIWRSVTLTLMPTIWNPTCGSAGDLVFSLMILAVSASWSYVIGPTLMSMRHGCWNRFDTSSSFKYSTAKEQLNQQVARKHVVLASSHNASGQFTEVSKGGLQERHSNLHSVDWHSSEWIFQRVFRHTTFELTHLDLGVGFVFMSQFSHTECT